MYTPYDDTYWYTILLSELEVTVAFVGFSDFWSAGTEEGKSSIGKPRFRSFRLEYRYRPIRLLGQDHAVVTEHRSPISVQKFASNVCRCRRWDWLKLT